MCQTNKEMGGHIANLGRWQMADGRPLFSSLLSDRFLLKRIAEICSLLGIKKLNTTAYHLQTDGIVERFNHTLLNMLSKTVKSGSQDWDVRLPYVLFAYRATM